MCWDLTVLWPDVDDSDEKTSHSETLCVYSRFRPGASLLQSKIGVDCPERQGTVGPHDAFSCQESQLPRVTHHLSGERSNCDDALGPLPHLVRKSEQAKSCSFRQIALRHPRS